MKAKGVILTILSAVLFGVTPVLASMSYELGSNAATLTFYRNLMVIPVLAIVMAVRKTDFRITKQQLGRIFLIGILGSGTTTVMLYASYDYVGISTATTLHFLYPVFVALICRIFYKDHLGKPKVLALIFASAGIALFLEPGEQMGMIGVILAVTSGLTYAFYMVGIEKFGLKSMDPFQFSFYLAISIVLEMLVYNIPTQDIVFDLSFRALLYTFIIAVCTSCFAVALLQLGVKYLNASSAAIFCLFEPITSSFCGVLLLHESLSIGKIVGSIVILVAAAILALCGNQNPSQNSQKSVHSLNQ